MFKALLALIITLFAAAALAAVDVNTASEAELDGIKGIGPGLSGKILEERRKTPFKDWSDFISRVSGVGSKSATHFSASGLTVNGKKFSATAGAKVETQEIKSDSVNRKPGDTVSKSAAAPVAKTASTAAPATPAKAPVVAPATTAPAMTESTGKK